MEFITWREEYNLGDALIDAQHKTFFNLVKDLVNMNQVKGQKLDVKQVVDFLVDYVAMHFQAEEALMSRINYPQLAEHQLVHVSFTKKVNEVVQQVRENPESISLEDLLTITQGWFLDHILEEDIKLKDWVKAD